MRTPDHRRRRLAGGDDRGRPGALAFHALFLSRREYRRTGFDPFLLEGVLRNDWTADAAARPLPSGSRAISPVLGWLESHQPDPGVLPTAARIAAALVGGHRVALEAAAPIDTLAQQVWQALPARLRRRASLATWAFANGNRFDLVALPRLAGVALDASYLDRATLESENGLPAPPRFHAASRGLVETVALVRAAFFRNRLPPGSVREKPGNLG